MAVRKGSHNLFSKKTNTKVRKNPNVKNYVRTAGLSAGDPRKGAKGVVGGNLRRTGRAYAEAAPGIGAVGLGAAKKNKKVAVAGYVAAEAGAVHGSYKGWQNQVKRQNKGRAQRVGTKKRTTAKKK